MRYSGSDSTSRATNISSRLFETGKISMPPTANIASGKTSVWTRSLVASAASRGDPGTIEAWATIEACVAALEAGGEPETFTREAERAYDWYFGRNDLGVALTDGGEGECFDGLTWAGANQNQGAESVLAFQLATCAATGLTLGLPARRSVGDR